MRISVKLPQIDPDVYPEVEACRYCDGQHFKAHGQKGNVKALRDFNYDEVSSKRVKCMRAAAKRFGFTRWGSAVPSRVIA